MPKTLNLGLFIVGLIIAIAAMIGIVGIGLIAASGRSNFKRIR